MSTVVASPWVTSSYRRPRRGTLLEPGAREPAGHEQPGHSGGGVEHGPAVGRGVVDAAVAAGERRPGERRHPPGQAPEGRGDHLVVIASTSRSIASTAMWWPASHPERRLSPVGPEVGAEHPVDHHRVPAGGPGPPEKAIWALGHDPELEPGRRAQRVDPRPASQRPRRPRPARRRCRPRPPGRRPRPAPRTATPADPRPQVHRPGREREGGRHPGRRTPTRARPPPARPRPGPARDARRQGRPGSATSVSTPTRRSMATLRPSQLALPGADQHRRPGDGEPAPAPDPVLQSWK